MKDVRSSWREGEVSGCCPRHSLQRGFPAAFPAARLGAPLTLCRPPPCLTFAPLYSFVPETILKSRKQRDALTAAAAAARKAEKVVSKTRRAGMLKRAEEYLNGAFWRAGKGALSCGVCVSVVPRGARARSWRRRPR